MISIQHTQFDSSYQPDFGGMGKGPHFDPCKFQAENMYCNEMNHHAGSKGLSPLVGPGAKPQKNKYYDSSFTF
jgi:hypothetical protein